MKNLAGILILFFLSVQQALAAPADLEPAEKPCSIIYSQASIKIDAADPKKPENESSYYPGMRGPNQLVIYTPKYGFRTGTNEYGTEAAAADNMVIGINGADTIIPYNGFVISGHGRAKKWIMQNIRPGAKVYIDYKNNVLHCFITPESLIYEAKEKIKEVNSLLEYYRASDISYDCRRAAEYIEKSKNLLSEAEKNPENTQSLVYEALKASNEALKNTIPYRRTELKGIWVRPIENSRAEIEQTIEKMHEAGITDIFLETFYHGKTIYDSAFLRKNGVISQHEDFKGFDPLEIWIKEAHKRDMKVHIWFECFYLGNKRPKDYPNHILTVHPEWSNKRLSNYASKEPVTSLSEHNGYFLDPANIQARAFLLGIIKEIIEKYSPDGINLDYLRYPQAADPSYSNYLMTNWGYTETARRQFKALYGKDPVNITLGSVEWNLWNLFRQDKISDFTKSVKLIAAPYNVTVTAVVFPDADKAAAVKMQDWRRWAERDYVDGITPLILTGDKNTAVKILQEISESLHGKSKVYPGVFSAFMGGSFEDLLMLLQKIREFNYDGAVIFDYAHLDSAYTEALQARIYNKDYNAQYSESSDKSKKFKKKKQKKKKKEKKKKEKKKHFWGKKE